MSQQHPEPGKLNSTAQSELIAFEVGEDTTDQQLERFILESLASGQQKEPGKLNSTAQGESFVLSSGEDTADQQRIGFIVNPPMSGQQPESDKTSSTVQGEYLVLVVEDHEPTQRLERFILEEAGYTVMVVASGGEALEALKDASPAMVLMDVGLTGMDGFTT